MFKEMAQLGSLLKQAQSLSGRMGDVQQRLAELRVSGRSSQGDVLVEFSGQGRAIGASIATAFRETATTDQLESAIVEAINDGLNHVQRKTAEELGAATGGLDLGSLGSALGSLGLGPKS